MTNCTFQSDNTPWTCTECGWIYPRPSAKPPCKDCFKLSKDKENNQPTMLQEPGPGDILHELLVFKFNVDFSEGCGCRKRINQMNEWGPEGCREHLTDIVAGMLDEAHKRQWKLEGKPLLSLTARLGTMTPWGMAYARKWARELVTEAIETYEERERERRSKDVDLRGNSNPGQIPYNITKDPKEST